jgi:hypothetical protein
MPGSSSGNPNSTMPGPESRFGSVFSKMPDPDPGSENLDQKAAWRGSYMEPEDIINVLSSTLIRN